MYLLTNYYIYFFTIILSLYLVLVILCMRYCTALCIYFTNQNRKPYNFIIMCYIICFILNNEMCFYFIWLKK